MTVHSVITFALRREGSQSIKMRTYATGVGRGGGRCANNLLAINTRFFVSFIKIPVLYLRD